MEKRSHCIIHCKCATYPSPPQFPVVYSAFSTDADTQTAVTTRYTHLSSDRQPSLFCFTSTLSSLSSPSHPVNRDLNIHRHRHTETWNPSALSSCTHTPQCTALRHKQRAGFPKRVKSNPNIAINIQFFSLSHAFVEQMDHDAVC